MQKKRGAKKTGSPDRFKARREAFCQEYLKDLNGTQAAIRAGYSRKTAGVQAGAILKRPDVKARVEELKAERAKRCGVEADAVLLELAKIAFSDPRQLFDGSGSILSIQDLDDKTARAVASVEVEELFEGRGEDRSKIGVAKKIRLWDKPKALELLAKHLGLLVERHEFGGNGFLLQVHDAPAPKKAGA